MGNFFRSKVFKGTLMLTVFSLFSKALGAIFKIGLSYFIGSFGLGIYQLVFPLLVFFVVLSSEGVATALTIKTAENKLSNQPKSYFKISILYVTLFSVLSALAVCLLAKLIGKLQGENIPQFVYYVMAVGIIAISILSVIKAEIRGEERFNTYSFAEIIEDFFKVVFGLLFAWAFIPYGVMFAVAGVIGGVSLSSLCAIIYLLIVRKHKKATIGLNVCERREFLKMSFLMVGADLVIPAVHFIEATIIINLLVESGVSSVVATELYGLSRGMVSAVLNLPFFLLSAFEILLLPNLARAKTNGIYYKKTQIGLFLAVFVMMPFVFLYLFFAPQVILAIYGSALSEREFVIAVSLLRLGAIGLVFSALTTMLVVILNSNNKAGSTFFASLIAGVAKLAFLVVFVPKLSIYGVELSSVLFAMVACLINLIFAVQKRVFVPPRGIVFVSLMWLAVFGCVLAVYNLLIRVLTNLVVACVLSFCIIGVVILGGLLIFYLFNKDKFISFFKRVLGL